MVECRACKSVFPDNTLFCEECGSYLPLGETGDTNPLLDPFEPEAERVAPKTITLCIKDGGCVELPLSKEVIIGRLDAAQGVFPDVDLTNEQGIQKGISRRHARIERREGQVFVEDLHSLNGTFLNTTHLVPGLPYALKDGDQVQLAKLVLTVHLK